LLVYGAFSVTFFEQLGIN